MHYALRVQGHLDPSWSDRFGGLRIEQRPSSQCENAMRSLEAFAILLASLNRRCAMERSR